MVDGAAPAAKAAPGTAPRAAAPAAIPQRMLSQPGEAAERSAQARAARGLAGALPAHNRSPRRRRYLPSGTLPEVAAQAGRGRPLSADRATDFGSLLDADLDHVRIHDDHDAAALAEAAGAR